MKKVLVTGGAGFIGSHLAEKLLSAGHSVVVLDNFSTGRRENLVPFAAHPAFRLIVGDIRDMEVCRRAAEGVSCVLHEAALGSVPRSVKDPGLSTEVNVSGFVNMLSAACEAGVKRFVYASSSSVYGDCPDSPKVEDRIGTPLSPYAVTKRADELFAANLSRICGVECIGLRYFNVFGPRQDPDGPYAAVIPRFIMALKEHRAPTINGDGSFSRDFTFVDDVIRANLLAMETEDPEAVNQIYNVAGGAETSINALFEVIRALAGAHDPEILEISPVHGPERVGDVSRSLASVDKVRRLLGCSPRFTVKEGLERTIPWYFGS